MLYLLSQLAIAGEMVDPWDYKPGGVNVRDTPFAEIVALSDLVILGTIVDVREEVFLGAHVPSSALVWEAQVDTVLKGPAAVGDRVIIHVDSEWPPEPVAGDRMAAALSYKIPYRDTKLDNPHLATMTDHIPPFVDRWMPTAGGSLFVRVAVDNNLLLGTGPAAPWKPADGVITWEAFRERFIAESGVSP